MNNYGKVLVTKWDMKVELIIQLYDASECKQKVDIVVYSKCRFQ